jgi:hypothetical protein
MYFSIACTISGYFFIVSSQNLSSKSTQNLGKTFSINFFDIFLAFSLALSGYFIFLIFIGQATVFSANLNQFNIY